MKPIRPMPAPKRSLPNNGTVMGISRTTIAVLPRGLRILAVALFGFSWAALPSIPLQAEERNLKGHGGPVKAIVVSEDGTRALSGSFDYSMILWDLTPGKPQQLHGFDDHDGAVNDAEFLPGNKRAVSASDDGTISLWDLKTHTLIKRFKGHSHKVVKIAVNQDGSKAVSASWDRTARIWDLANLRPGPVLKGHRNTINDAAFSIDGKHVFTASYDGTIRQWRTSDGEETSQLYSHGWGVNVIAALPDGERLLFGGLNGFIGILNIKTGKIDRPLRPSERPFLSLAVNPKLNLAAAGAGDGRISVWDMATWKEKFSYENPFGPAWALALLNDGKSLYFGSLDDEVILWQMTPAKPFEPAEGKYPRRFQITEGIDPGALQFARKCSICHTLTPDTANRAGPSLFKLFGRKVGTLPGYSYSKALTSRSFTWTGETVEALFAEGPENYVPGTKMPLQKMSNPQERKALIAFLKHATETGKPANEAYVSYEAVKKKQKN
ncbi:MAG: c-type cytochrome [Alphaproteobacteria bacterium]|nr:c-type cytochrome [Alphaproteobacteria bacterium]